MPRFRKGVGLGVFIAAIGIVLSPTAVGVRLEEDLALGWLFAVRGPVEPPPEVVVVSIDKPSADQLGLKTDNWPPPRHIHASIIQSLSRHGVSAIMMDVFFRLHRTAGRRQQTGRRDRAERQCRVVRGGGPAQIRGRRNRPDALAHRAVQGCGTCDSRVPATRGHGGQAVFWTFFDATSETVPTLPAVALQIHALPHLDRFISLLGQAGVSDLTDLPSRFATFRDCRQLMHVLRREIEAIQTRHAERSGCWSVARTRG